MKKVLIYVSVLSQNLKVIQNVIEVLFPDNRTLLIPEDNALRSDGILFEASVEPYHYYKTLTEFLMSGSLLGPSEYFDQFLRKFIIECEGNGIIYNIEFEENINGEYIEKSIKHPDFVKLTSSPTEDTK